MNQSISYPQVEVDKFQAITLLPIDVNAVLEAARNIEAGAMVTFTGTVRAGSHGKTATGLWYEAYMEMSETMMRQILKDAREKFALIDAFCQHRIGELKVTDVAVIVVTTSVHRKEAYDANQYIIDRVKFELPIWKKEYYTDETSKWSHNFH